MKNIGIIWGVFVVTAAFASACAGDDKAAAPGNQGGKGGTAGSANESGDAGQGDAGTPTKPSGGSPGKGGSGGSSGVGGGAGGSGGSENEPVGFVSQPVGVELVVDAAAQALGFTLRSSRLTQEEAGNMYYQEWLAELHNGTDETQCFIQLAADFQTSTGTSVLKLDTYAYGAAFDSGSGLGVTITCARPGESVPVWSNALGATSIALSSIKKLSVEVVGMPRPNAVIHPSTPKLGAVTETFNTGLEWWQMSGTATSAADVYNIKLEFWGKSGGFIVGKAAAFHSEDLPSGQVWSFETLAGIAAPTLDEATPYFSFIDGLDSNLRVIYDAETSKLIEIRELAQASWRSAEERKDRAR